MNERRAPVDGRRMNESAETQLKQLLAKAIDDAWLAGIEKGKAEGRRAGIEEAAAILRGPDAFDLAHLSDIEGAILALLEANE